MTMAVTTEPVVQWVTAAPLWNEITSASNAAAFLALRAPTILRFATDSFMDEFLALLNVAPARLGERRVQPETWREPLPLPAPLPLPPLPAVPRGASPVRPVSRSSATTGVAQPLTGLATGSLKLYHPAHQRFYLVCASLVCRIPGMPDRTLDTANQERATFVLRRLQPHTSQAIPDTTDPTTYDEFAFVASDRGNTWQQITGTGVAGADPGTVLAAGEDQLPLFPTVFAGADGHKRRLLSGLVPVGRREVYLGAPLLSPQDIAAATSPQMGFRETMLLLQVLQPWENLIELNKNSTPASGSAADALQRQLQVASWYILLDLAAYLAKYLPNVWQVIQGQQPASGLTVPESQLFNALSTTFYTEGGTSTAFSSALVNTDALRNQLERVTEPYTDMSTGWPQFHFLLSDHHVAELFQPSAPGAASLQQLIEAALPVQAPEEAFPPPPVPQTAPNTSAASWFVIRCVFERPHCGPLQPPVVSGPSSVFELAGYFDPDAPARPIRISLPIDTSFAGLRKFSKNVTFLISDKLQQQIQCATDAQKILKGDGVCSNQLTLGSICTFSIPIITICALLLLLVFVILLNIIFFWQPLFKICFPLPGLKAKE